MWGSEEGAMRVTARAGQADFLRGALRGRQTRSMRFRFTAQSVRLRLAALLLLLVIVAAVGDWTACPSLLLLWSGSCIMVLIRSTVFHSGMSSLCVLRGARMCAHTHIHTHTQAGTKSRMDL